MIFLTEKLFPRAAFKNFLASFKLAKLDEYVQDLLHLTEKTNGELSMASSSKYNSIKEILVELNKLNCE